MSKRQQDKVPDYITNISDSDSRQVVFAAGESLIPVYKDDRETPNSRCTNPQQWQL